MLARILAILIAVAAVSPAHAVTTYTTSNCQPKPTPGDAASQNTWGTLVNTGANIVDGITSVVTSISVAGGANVVLTFNCGSVDQTDAAHFIFTGVLTGNINVLWPNTRTRMFSVTNSTTGSFTLSLGANNGSGSPAGTATALAQGSTGIYYSDGTNVLPRVSAGGITLPANSLIGNATSGSAPATAFTITPCSGGLTYTAGTAALGCNSGGGGGGGGGTALAWGGVPATSFNAAVNTIYCPDTSLGGFNMTLPATPAAGNEIDISDCAGTFAPDPLVVLNNGNLLMRLNQNLTINVGNVPLRLIYTGVTFGWLIF